MAAAAAGSGEQDSARQGRAKTAERRKDRERTGSWLLGQREVEEGLVPADVRQQHVHLVGDVHGEAVSGRRTAKTKRAGESDSVD